MFISKHSQSNELWVGNTLSI